MHCLQKMKRNPLLLFWGRALVEMKVLTAVVVLFYLHRGVSIEEVFYLSIVWSLSSLVTEVPSGYLADKIGRKRTLLLGVGLFACAHLATYFAHGFWQFAGIFILMSSAFSCFSGTEEAMLYETLLSLGKEQEMTQRNGRLRSARNMFKIFVPILGVFIARDLGEEQFRVLIMANFFFAVGAFVVLLFLMEPEKHEDIMKHEVGILKQSLQTIRTHTWLLRFAINRGLVFTAIFLAFRTYQPLLIDRGLDVLWLGLFYFLVQASLFTVFFFYGFFEKLVGIHRMISYTVVIAIFGLIGAVYFDSLVLVFASLVIADVFGSFREPAFAHAINKRVDSRSRATTLSNLNLVQSILDIPMLFIAGYFASVNLEYALILGVALCVVALIFFPIRKSELAV